ncbi:MAG: hypothetical protein R2706_19450 [Acidimicrobiales bacterium]
MQAILLLLAATFITFLVTSWAADPLSKLATCNTCDQSAYDRLIELYELDKSPPERY